MTAYTWKRAAAFLAVLAGLAVLVTGTTWFLLAPDGAPPERDVLDAAEEFARGKDAFNRGQYRRALAHYERALRQQPGTCRFLIRAAEAAMRAGGREKAFEWAEKAWRQGCRDGLLVRIQVACSPHAKVCDRLEHGLELASGLDDPVAARELRADVYALCMEPEKSLKILGNLVAEHPSSRLVSKYARALVNNNRLPDAVSVLEDYRRQHLLEPDGVRLLASTLAARGHLPQAVDVLESSRIGDNYDLVSRVQHALLLYLLDRGAEAATLLEGEAVPPGSDEDRVINHRARLLLALLYAGNGRRQDLAALAETVEEGHPVLEGERRFVDYLLAVLDERPRDAMDNLQRAEKLLRGNALVSLQLGREHYRRHNYRKAIHAYRQIHGLLSVTPRVIVEHATALQAAGRLEEALTLVEQLHARGVTSQASIRLLRDLSLATGQYARSWSLQQLLQEASTSDSVKVKAEGALLALNIGMLDAADSLFRQIESQHPERLEAPIGRALVLLRQARPKEALRVLENSDDENPAVVTLRGQAYAETGRIREAERCYRRVLQKHPSDRIRLALANLLLATGRSDEAGKLYGAITTKPYIRPAALGRARIHLQEGRVEKARKLAERIGTESPSLPMAHYIVAQIDLLEGRPDNALQACESEPLDSVADPAVKMLKATALMRLGRFAEAETLYEQLGGDGAVRPVFLLRELAAAKVRLGKYAEALELADALESRENGWRDAFRIRLNVLVQQQAYDRALSSVEAASSRLPPNVRALYTSRIREKQGRLDEAASVLKPFLTDRECAMRWAACSAGRVPAERICAVLEDHEVPPSRWLRLGMRAEARTDPTAAARFYKKAMEDDPRNVMLLNNYAWNAVQQDDFDKASVLAAASQARRLAPRNAKVLHTYARVLMACGRDEECRRLLAPLPILDDHPSLLLQLAEACQSAGRKDEAVSAYRRYLRHPQVESGTEDAAQARQSLKTLEATK